MSAPIDGYLLKTVVFFGVAGANFYGEQRMYMTICLKRVVTKKGVFYATERGGHAVRPAWAMVESM